MSLFNETPLLPAYNQFGYSLFNETPLLPAYSQFGYSGVLRGIASRMKLKLSSSGRPLSLRQLETKIRNSLRAKTKMDHNRAIMKEFARKSGVPVTRNGREKTPIQLLRDIINIPKNKGNNVQRTKGDKIRQPRTTNFGWWDNTQKSYCDGGQCGMMRDSGVPYYGDWSPYSSIRGPS